METRKPPRPAAGFMNHLIARQAMIGQSSRDAFIARNTPKMQAQGPVRLGASGIAKPWTGAKKRTGIF